MNSFSNIILRIGIFLSIFFVAFVFISPNAFKTKPSQKRIELIQSDLMDKYDIYFINTTKASKLITGKLLLTNEEIIVKGKVKLLGKKRVSSIEITFEYYSEQDKKLGSENITIEREASPGSIMEFQKQGLTIPLETKEIHIKVE